MKKWTKVVYLFGVTVMLAPNFIVTGTAVAETIDSSTAETTTTSEETKPSETEESKAVDPNVRAAIEGNVSKTEIPVVPQTTESSTPEPEASTNKEAIESGKEQNEKSGADQLVTDAQINELKAKLPEGSEVIFENGKLTIKLPAGVEPEVGKQAVVEMGLQDVDGLEIEVIANLATQDGKSASFRFGYQNFYNGMRQEVIKEKSLIDVIGFRWIKTKTGNLPLVAYIMDAEAKKLEGKALTQDEINKELVRNSANSYDYDNAQGNDNKKFYANNGTYSFSSSRGSTDQGNFVASDFYDGYEAARRDFYIEFNEYLNRVIRDGGLANQDAVANNNDYRQDAATMDIVQVFISLGGGFISGKLEEKLPAVWNYPGGDNTPGFDPEAAPGVKSLVKQTQESLTNLIKFVMPTVQSILTKKALDDPRAIGGLDGVILPDKLSVALAENPNFSTVLGWFDFNSAVDTKVADRVYKDIRNAIKASLVNHAQTGVNDYVGTILSGTKKVSGSKSIATNYSAGQILDLAQDAGFTLAEKYLGPAKELAIRDILSGKAKHSDGKDLLAALEDNTTGFDALKKEKAGADRFNDGKVGDSSWTGYKEDSGKAVREVLLRIYTAEYDAIQKAIEDYKADPTYYPKDSDAPIKQPIAGKDLAIKDYLNVRRWLYNAGIEKVKHGIVAADLKSHELLNGNVPPLDNIPTSEIIASVPTTVDEGTIKGSLLATAPYRAKLEAIAKEAYRYSYDLEAKKANISFNKGYESFDYYKQHYPSQPGAVFDIWAGDLFDQTLTYNTEINEKGDKYPFRWESFINQRAKAEIRDDLTGVIIDKATNKPINLTGKISDVNKDLKGIAFSDGLAKAAKDRMVKIHFNPIADPGQEDDFENSKLYLYDGIYIDGTFLPLLNSFNRFADLGAIKDGKYTITFPVMADWEPSIASKEITLIKEGGNKNIKIADKEFTPTRSQGDAGTFLLNQEYDKTITVSYSRLIRPQVNNLSAKGVKNGKTIKITGKITKKDSAELLDSEYVQVNLYKAGSEDGPLGELIAENIKPREDGSFEFTTDKLKENEYVGAKAVFTKNKYKNPGYSESVYAPVTIVEDKNPTILSFESLAGGKDAVRSREPISGIVAGQDSVNLKNIQFYWKDTNNGKKVQFRLYKGSEQIDKIDATSTGATENKSSFNIPVDKISVGDNQFSIQSYFYVEGDSEPYPSSTAETQLNFVVKAEGALGFSVTTKDVNDTEGLYWKGSTSSREKIFDRVDGNDLKISVTDTRTAATKNKNWAVTADYDKNIDPKLNFVWGTNSANTLINNTKVFDATTVTPNSDETEWTKTYNADQGVLLKTNEAIAVGKYATSNNKSSAITWTLHDTYKPE